MQTCKSSLLIITLVIFLKSYPQELMQDYADLFLSADQELQNRELTEDNSIEEHFSANPNINRRNTNRKRKLKSELINEDSDYEPEPNDLDNESDYISESNDLDNYSDYASEAQALNKSKRKKKSTGDFICSECGKSLYSAESLCGHIKNHNKKRNNKCEICLKTFKQKCHLKTHLLIHSGEKPYHCTICQKAFSDESNRKQHQKTHRK